MIDVLFYLVIGAIVIFFIYSVCSVFFHTIGEAVEDKEGVKAAKQILEICNKYPSINSIAKTYRPSDYNFKKLLEEVEKPKLLNIMSDVDRTEFERLAERYRQCKEKSLEHWRKGGGPEAAERLIAQNAGQSAGKKAAKQVVKGAVVGAIIAGEAGAVVGATAAKAKVDADAQSGKK